MQKFMIKILLLLVLLFGLRASQAQDILVMRNGDELKVKIEEVLTESIKYKKFDNLGGPSYTVKKSSVFMIRYENGTKDVFKESGKKNDAANTSVKSTPYEIGKGSINVNPLGFLQFGPIIQYEARVGPRMAVVPYFRYAYAGLATHAAWDTYEEDNEMSPGSAGIGLGVKGFTSTTSAFYYGSFLDYSWTTARYNVGDFDASEQIGNHLTLLSNFGYRWKSGSGGYINLGAFAGAAFTLKNEERYIDSGELIEKKDEVIIFAMLELSFGWEF